MNRILEYSMGWGALRGDLPAGGAEDSSGDRIEGWGVLLTIQPGGGSL